MYKDFRCGNALIQEVFQHDFPCFIPADGLLIRQTDCPHITSNVLIFFIIGRFHR